MDGWIDAVEAEARGRKKERERKKRCTSVWVRCSLRTAAVMPDNSF